METNSIIRSAALGVCVISALIAAGDLVYRILDAPAAGLIIESLRSWVEHTGYRVALIILATSATVYITSRK